MDNYLMEYGSEDQTLAVELKKYLNIGLMRIIVSNPRTKDGIFKIKVRPVNIEGKLYFQATEYIDTKVYHHNYDENEMPEYFVKHIMENFKQCEILWNANGCNDCEKKNEVITVTILVSKKGKITIKKKHSPVDNTVKENDKNTAQTMWPEMSFEANAHNRTKNYILQEGIPVPFLIDLGVMNKNGEVLKPKYDKFRQINRFLEFVRDIVKNLPKDREIIIIDFGCGKSYLTFAIYYYLHVLCKLDVNITGLDLKKDVIDKCNKLSEKYGYDKLVFKMGDIAQYNEQDKVDMVVTLHACDTATDYALHKAMTWNAKVILSVPCCQHELNRQIENSVMSPILQYGILKDRIAAAFTDAIRAQVLEINGYKTEILEFIDMEHTPKNLMIRAVKGHGKGNPEALKKLVEEYNLSPTIMNL